MKLAAVHRPTIAPNHSNGPVRAGQHFLDRLAQSVGDVGRQPAEDVDDGQLRILALAEQMRDRGGEDEEGKQREDRQIGEIAGVDEAVVIDADRDPLDHFPSASAAA